MPLVIDASVAVKWFVREVGSDEALTVLADDQALLAPDLLLSEVANAAWKKVQLGQILSEQAVHIVQALPRAIHDLVPLASLIDDALAIALELKHPVYDCLYLALAEREDAQLVTDDRRFATRLRGTPWAKRLRHLRPQAAR